MTETITFFVPGRPQSTARPRVRAYIDGNGKARGQAYMPQTTQFAHQAVRHAAQEALRTSGMPGWPEGAVTVNVLALFTYPKSTAKKRLIDNAPMSQKPDVENLAKTVMDGCSGILYRDDAQVSCLIVSKLRVVDPLTEGMWVTVKGTER